MAAKIKLTDALIKYAQSGKSDRSEWKQFESALVEKYGLIVDADVNGFKVVRSGKDIISFRYYYRVNGKRKNITLGQFPAITTVQARTLAKEKALDVANGNNPIDDKQAARIEVQNTLKSYLDGDYKDYMETSGTIRHAKYLNIIRNGFPELLNKPLAEITKTDLNSWGSAQKKLHDKKVKGYASATIIQRRGALKTLMTYAFTEDVIESNPFDKARKLEFNQDESTEQMEKRTYLELEQQLALLASVDAYDEKLRAERRNSRANGKPHLPSLDNVDFASHHKPMMLILFYMGMRTGDVVSLEWTHVIDTPFIRNITKVLEKTRRKVKTPYKIPMPEPVRDMLRTWRKQQGNPTSGLVFPDPDNGERLCETPLDDCWEWIKQDAEFHEDLQLYTLRHNYTSWLIMDNVPLTVVAQMIGNASTDMINRNYGHLIKGATDDAAQGFVDRLKKQA